MGKQIRRMVEYRSGAAKILIVPSSTAHRDALKICPLGRLDIIRCVTEHECGVRIHIQLSKRRNEDIRIGLGFIGIICGRRIVDEIVDSSALQEFGNILASGGCRNHTSDAFAAEPEKQCARTRTGLKMGKVPVTKAFTLSFGQLLPETAFRVNSESLRYELVAAFADEAPYRIQSAIYTERRPCLNKGARVCLIAEKKRAINVQNGRRSFRHSHSVFATDASPLNTVGKKIEKTRLSESPDVISECFENEWIELSFVPALHVAKFSLCICFRAVSFLYLSPGLHSLMVQSDFQNSLLYLSRTYVCIRIPGA